MSHNTTQTEKSIGRTDRLTNYCSHCEAEFVPENAHSVLIRGPGYVIWGCPNCGRTSRGIAPEEVARPPVIADLNVTADADGLITCEIVFPNEARLQYRETEDGHVREKVLSSIGEELESIDLREVNTFDAFAKAVKRYTEFIESGVRREMPHLAAAILDEHN